MTDQTSTEFCKLLRARAINAASEGDAIYFNQAAKIITSQAAEIERLTKKRDSAAMAAVSWRNSYDDLETANTRLFLRAEAAEAALEKMREAESSDKARLDFLEKCHVAVRWPIRWGSRGLFSASPEDADGAENPSDIRAQTDAALTTQGGAA